MVWIFGLILAGGFLASRFGGGPSSESAIPGNPLESVNLQQHGSLFDDDDDISSASSFSDASIFDSVWDNSMMDCTYSINPANGMPMVGCLDIEGNMYGTDLSSWNDDLISSNSMMDDCFSSTSSMYDDSFSSSCTSMFDD